MQNELRDIEEGLRNWDGHSAKGQAAYDRMFEFEKWLDNQMYCQCGHRKFEEHSYCEGDYCYRSGVVPPPAKDSAEHYVNEYAMSGFFNFARNFPVIQVIASIGHPTAETKIVSQGCYVYVGQPICGASRYFRVPKELAREFLEQYIEAGYCGADVIDLDLLDDIE